MPVPILGILALLSSLLSTGIRTGQAATAASRQKKSEKEIEKAETQQRKRRERAARRQAIARAIGYDKGFAPGPEVVVPKPYTGEELWPYDVGAGLTDIAGQSAAMGMTRTGDTALTTQTTSPQTTPQQAPDVGYAGRYDRYTKRYPYT